MVHESLIWVCYSGNKEEGTHLRDDLEAESIESVYSFSSFFSVPIMCQRV